MPSQKKNPTAIQELDIGNSIGAPPFRGAGSKDTGAAGRLVNWLEIVMG